MRSLLLWDYNACKVMPPLSTDLRPRRAFRRPAFRLWLTLALLVVGVGGMALASLWSLRVVREQAVQGARARVEHGLAAVQRLLDERQRRLGDQAEALVRRPALVAAFLARDQAALDTLLSTARSQFAATAAAVVDERGRAVAEQPTRAPYDFSQIALVRQAIQATQPANPQRRGIEGRPSPTDPKNELGLVAAYPILVDGAPVGAVVLLRVFNDAYMQELSQSTGVHVAVVTAEKLIAGSRDVRELFQPPKVRPPSQRLAPVEPVHRLGESTFIAIGDPVRAWMQTGTPVPPLPGGNPGSERPGPGMGIQGPANVATLFVGVDESEALAGLEPVQTQLLVLLAVGCAAALACAFVLAPLVEAPVGHLVARLEAGARGETTPAMPGGGTQESAALAAAYNAASGAVTARLRALRDELRKLEAVIDSVAEGIVVLDDDARLLTANATALRLLGLPDGLAAGTDLSDALTPGQWEVLRPALVRRDRYAAEINLDEPRQAIVRVAAVPVHDDFARSLGRAIVLQDVTEERLLDNVKADFFTAMSHELRTPLSAIKGAAELLLDDDLPATQQHFVGTIHRNADRLSRLVTDLLDVGKLESGRVALRLARVDLNEIVADVVAALGSVAERDGLTLVNRATDGALPLTADHGRLEQIVTNLVSNACQYTAAGGEITVSTWRDDGYVYLLVADNGVGISTVDQQHLFDKFYQGVNALTHKRGGSGLGLTIVKHLAELHDGRVSVQSKLGSGSTFTVRLPVAPGASPAAKPTDGGGPAAASIEAAERAGREVGARSAS